MATKTAEKIQIKASHRFARISPRKVGLVLGMIRGKSVEEALNILRFSSHRASYFTSKVLKSAVANAEHLNDLPDNDVSVDVDRLFISRAVAEQGPTIKRFRPVGMGRAFPIKRRTCHIKLTLEEASGVVEEVKKKKRN